MSLLGGFVDAAASLLGGLQANAAAKAQAKRLRMQADQQNAEASLNAQSVMQSGERAEASGFNDAANGGGVTGSAFAVLNDFFGQNLFNARAQIYRGQTAAASSLYQANVAKVNGQNALTQSVFQAGSSILGGMDDKNAAKAASAAGGA